MAMTWGVIGAIFMIVVLSLIVGFVDAWLEQRKRDKTERG